MSGYFDYFWFQILSPGVYRLSKDQMINFNVDDLTRMASAFNDLKPARPAPVVIGHPENDAPSYGTVAHLRVQDNALVGWSDDLTDSYRRQVREGNYQRYGAQFFAPENPNNPVPGSWFLKHVGVRGMVPPIVRGYLTSDAEFAEQHSGAGKRVAPEMRSGGPGCIEFSEFLTAPAHPENMALLARAHQNECASRGKIISTAEAVQSVSMTAQRSAC
jgi:hypothetical protein